MRIAFLTGSLEPGRDGVGDYTRLLAEECARRGNDACVVAFADRHVAEPASESSAALSVLRLPARASFRARVAAARAAFEAFAPSWLSVQFVPYSYGRRGVPLAFAHALPRLAGRARLHVMFHETWIGGDGPWRRLVSAGQRYAAQRVGCRADAVVHTSNPLYRHMLAGAGIRAGVLPMFGSVPVAGGGAPARWLDEPLRAAGCDALHAPGSWWTFVMFGTLHPIWPPEPLLGRLHEVCAAAGRRPVVVSVGHLGTGEALWARMAERYTARGFVFVRLGGQPAPRVADVLRTADFGIATTPYVLLGKSASAAAMFDHGVPVIVNRDDGPPCAEPLDARRRALTLRLSELTAERLLGTRRQPPEWSLHRCADQWLEALEPCA